MTTAFTPAPGIKIVGDVPERATHVFTALNAKGEMVWQSWTEGDSSFLMKLDALKSWHRGEIVVIDRRNYSVLKVQA